MYNVTHVTLYIYTYLRAAAPAADPGKDYLCRYFADFLEWEVMILPKRCCICSTYIYMDQQASINPKPSKKIYPKFQPCDGFCQQPFCKLCKIEIQLVKFPEFGFGVIQTANQKLQLGAFSSFISLTSFIQS